MNYILTKTAEKGFSIKGFLGNIKEFFTGDGFVTTLLRYGFITFILFALVSYIVAGIFYRIVHDEMDKGGEEYGEIAATKVANKAVFLRVISVVFIIITIAVLFFALAFV